MSVSDQNSAPPSAPGYAPQRDEAPAPPPPPPPNFGAETLIHAAPPHRRPAAPALNEPLSAAPGANPIQVWVENTDRSLQRFLDRLAPHQLYRWLSLAFLLALFVLRMFMVQGFYIVPYVLLIFLLNQFILFVQPKDRASLIARRLNPEGSENAEASEPALPTHDADEFRPFVRRLPEFKFWYSSTVATILAIYATFFSVFDVPVFWPVLVFYFIVLFFATMHRQWLDMKRLKYVPWDIGNKKTYKSDPKRMSVMPRDAASVARAAMDSAVLHPRGSGAPDGQLPSPGAPAPVQTVKRGAPAPKPLS